LAQVAITIRLMKFVFSALFTAFLTCQLLHSRAIRLRRPTSGPGNGDATKSVVSDKIASDVTVLSWADYGMSDLHLDCGRDASSTTSASRSVRCMITSERKHLANASALYWDLVDINLADLPINRPLDQLWVAGMTESPCIYDLAREPSVLGLFNIGVGISQQAHVQRCPYVHPKILTQLWKSPLPTAEKDRLRHSANDGIGLVAYIQGNCEPQRDGLVEALQAHGIQVDALGRCKHNRDLPVGTGFDHTSSMDSEEFIGFERRYKLQLVSKIATVKAMLLRNFFDVFEKALCPFTSSGAIPPTRGCQPGTPLSDLQISRRWVILLGS